jgi:hypothetical protein
MDRHAVRSIQRVLSLAAMVNLAQPSAASVLQVPQQYPSIQSGIVAAVDGDTVRVSAGLYFEMIDFLGKDITVESTSGADLTIIDGERAGTVVQIVAGAQQMPVLRGFTVRGGYGSPFGGGITVYGGPALIEHKVVENLGCPGGISAAFSTATIRNNVISDNAPNCSGGFGGGIEIRGAGAVRLLDNMIARNVASANGGGVSLFAAGAPIIAGNVIVDNAAGGGAGGWGGGIALANASDALITNNFIVGNAAFAGGGIYWLVPAGQSGPNVVNNTIAGNTALQGSAVLADGFDIATRLTNNILVGTGAVAVLECGTFNDVNSPIIAFNDVFHTEGGLTYGGVCADQTGVNGNISVDPLFVDATAGNFHLQPTSRAIDAGMNAGAPNIDIDGDSRPIDGNGDGVARVDLGADEVFAVDHTPPTVACSISPELLWPPNHKLHKVTAAVSASDDSGSVAVTLVAVTSSQTDASLDADDASADMQEWAVGTDDRSGLLRAERVNESRVYTLTYRAEDPAGNTATCAVAVTVPKSQGRR